MADNLTIKVDAKDLERLAKEMADVSITKSQAQRIGQGMVSDMKKAIATGLSPIKGNGRFPAYKDPARYPAGKKPQRPVNLFLTGDMLEDLQERSDAKTIEIGYFKSSEADKERGHREGANGQPKRPTIPEGTEEFNETIQLNAEEAFRDALDEQLDKLK